MALPSNVLKRDDIRKILAIEINSHDGGSFYFTDSRSLRDNSGNVYSSRLKYGYELTETIGSQTAPSADLGTGIGGAVSPNLFKFSLDNSEDDQGNTLDNLRNRMSGAEVVVRLGADFDSSGVKIPFTDFEEKFHGRIQSFRRGNDEWAFECVSPEGYRSSEMIVRSNYLGVGYGVNLDNSGGTSAAWLTGTSSTAFSPTSGKYSWSTIVTMSLVPSDVGVDGNIFSMGTRVEAWIRSSDDQLEISHHNGTISTSIAFTMYTFAVSEVPVRVSVRYDGTSAHLYINSILKESKAIATLPASDATTLDLGRNGSSAKPLTVTFYEFWLGNTDIGDGVMRGRSAGPLLYDFDNQQDLFTLQKFLEGGISPLPATTSDQSFNIDLTLGGTASFVSIGEGDDPNVSPTAIGKSKPFIIGRCFNVPPVLLTQVDYNHEYSVESSTVDIARVVGSPMQIAYSDTGIHAMAKTPLNAFEDVDIAKIVFARNDDIGRAGSVIEVSGGHANDGIYEVIGITGNRWVEVSPSFVSTDRSANVTITIPEIGVVADATDTADGHITTAPIDGKLTVDCISTLHGIPTIEDSYTFFRNSKIRASSQTVINVTWDDFVDITWVGENGEKDQPWSIAIPYGEDISHESFLQKLLDSYFAWSSDTVRVDVSAEPPPVLYEGVRMGHYRAPASGGTSYRDDIVEEFTIGEEDVLPPIWRLTIKYKPNYTVLGNDVPSGVRAGEREALTRPYSELLIAEDKTIKDANESAREVSWEVNFFNAEDALRIGQRIWNFFSTQRTWRQFTMNSRPEDFQVGEDITIPHPRFEGDNDLFVSTKIHNITERGVKLITIS